MTVLNETLERFLIRLIPSRWRAKLQEVSNGDRDILRGMGQVAAFLLVAKIIAAGKEMLVAYRYGTSSVVDGYLYIYNLAQWPVSLFLSVGSLVLIPYLVRLRAHDPLEVGRLRTALMPYVLAIGVGISILFGVGLWWLVDDGFSGLDGVGQTAALAAIPWLVPTVALGFLSTMHSVWLMSESRHANTLLEALPAVGIALCLVAWPVESATGWDVLPLAAGTLAGFAVQAALLGYLTGHRTVVNEPADLSAHWPALRGAFSTMLLAQVVVATANLIDQFLSVRMGEGVLATLSYANRVMSLLLGLSATVISRAMLPVFSGVADPHASFNLAQRWAWLWGVAGLVGTLILFLIARPAVALLFQRGAFSEDDTQAVSSVLRILGAQLPVYLASIVLVQWVGALGKPVWLLLSVLFGFAARVVGAIALFPFGAAGLAGSTVIMYTVNAGAIYTVARRWLHAGREGHKGTQSCR